MPKPRPTIAILHFLIIEVCCGICPDEWVEESAKHCHGDIRMLFPVNDIAMLHAQKAEFQQTEDVFS